MSVEHHIIYIPGLGDQRPLGQDKAIHAWRVFGVTGHYHPMYWNDKEPFALKFKGLLKQIDELVAEGHKVSLVAASAGASAALNAYAARIDGIASVALICGKVNNPQNMRPSVFRNNPAFQGSMALLPESLKQLDKADRAKILSLHGVTDHSVPPQDTIIEGAKEHTMPIFGHMLGIAYGLTLGALFIVRFLTRTARQESHF